MQKLGIKMNQGETEVMKVARGQERVEIFINDLKLREVEIYQDVVASSDEDMLKDIEYILLYFLEK